MIRNSWLVARGSQKSGCRIKQEMHNATAAFLSLKLKVITYIFYFTK